MPIRILVDSEDGGLRELVSGFLLPLGKLSDCKKNRKRVGILPAKVWWGPADPQFCSSRSRTRSLDLLHRGHSTHPRTMHCQDRRPCWTSSLVQHLIVFPEGSWTGCPGKNGWWAMVQASCKQVWAPNSFGGPFQGWVLSELEALAGLSKGDGTCFEKLACLLEALYLSGELGLVLLFFLPDLTVQLYT